MKDAKNSVAHYFMENLLICLDAEILELGMCSSINSG